MQLRTAFLVADKDQSSGLKPREFINAFGNVLGKGQGRKALMQLFMSIDADAGGTIGKSTISSYTMTWLTDKNFAFPASRMARVHELHAGGEQHSFLDEEGAFHLCEEHTA